jgi:hypothetical protein
MELDDITCAVWLQALKEAVEAGAWFIPGAPEAGAVARTALRIVKGIKRFDNIGGKKAWVAFVEDNCGVKNWDVVDKAFDLGALAESL